MLANLIDNGCKWATRMVRVSANVAADDMLAIIIEDDGAGIAGEYLEVVFGFGNRLDETVSGSGLGLPIAARACDPVWRNDCFECRRAIWLISDIMRAPDRLDFVSFSSYPTEPVCHVSQVHCG